MLVSNSRSSDVLECADSLGTNAKIRIGRNGRAPCGYQRFGEHGERLRRPIVDLGRRDEAFLEA